MDTQNQLPTAAEARFRIDALNDAEVSTQWKEISEAVDLAVKKGEESISLTKLLESNKNRLESMGYSCAYRQAGYNEYEWTVKW